MVDEEFTIEMNVDMRKGTQELMKYSALLYGYLGLLKRLGLPEDAVEMISMIQRLIAQINMLRASMIALQAASGPIGWALAGLSMAGTILTMSDVS